MSGVFFMIPLEDTHSIHWFPIIYCDWDECYWDGTCYWDGKCYWDEISCDWNFNVIGMPYFGHGHVMCCALWIDQDSKYINIVPNHDANNEQPCWIANQWYSTMLGVFALSNLCRIQTLFWMVYAMPKGVRSYTPSWLLRNCQQWKKCEYRMWFNCNTDRSV